MPQMDTSTVVAVKDRLLQLLRAAEPDVQIDYFHQGDTQDDESIFYHHSLDGTSDVPTLKVNRKARQENYTLPVIIEVLVPSGEVREAEVRCEELYGVLDGVLADDAHLGVDFVDSATLGGHTRTVGAIPDRGSGARITADVNIRARLQ